MTSSALARGGAEFLGTALLVGIGTGAVVYAVRHGGIEWGPMAIAWTFAVLLPILAFVRVSGAHLNPAVTLALAASGRIAWREAPLYLTGQFGGAFAGSALVLALVGNAAHLGANVPAAGELASSLAGELGFTALLVGSVFVLADRGDGPGHWRLVLPPAVVGVATFVLGSWTGTCSLNPARALAPAVLSGTFTDLWVYLLVTTAGGLLVAVAWRPRSVDRDDRGPGRRSSTR